MHFRLFDRPLIVDDPLASMYIDGQYEDYNPGQAYEGRVQIHGAVGFAKVEVLSANLPPGYYVYVDNVTKEVVVRWSPYTPPTETFTLVENGDFSAGDNGAWTNTGADAPFVIEPDSGGNMSMKFKEGFGGGYYSESVLAPIKDINRQITATGRIAQGKSSKRKLWGGIVLAFHDANRNLLNYLESNWVNSGGDYKDVKVVAAAADSKAKFVSVRIQFDRKGQNYPAWADDIKWDHSWTKGYNDDEQLSVTVRVTDSLNNTATHTGTIDERSNWYYGKLNGLYMYDSLGLTGTALGINFGGQQHGSDYAALSGSVTSFLSNTVVKADLKSMESISISGAIASMRQRNVAIRYVSTPEAASLSGRASSFKSKTHVDYKRARAETVTISARIGGFRIT
ncbi:tail fiber protein [Xylella phage Paz]|uniref:Tail fiber protein n=1 Tax=Xylella phage Paz TaxID=1415145 RepID=V5Q7L7_9CAUD|nr:tail fiber protein [Xylella phage Paz]AHB12137.1 tail fiber protein [Xylella phage Paz]